MGVEYLDDQTALIDGMTPDEYSHMMENEDQLEVFVAQKCPEAYVTGLEMGTILRRISALKATDLDDQGWDRIQTAYDALKNDYMEEREGTWTRRAGHLGILAGFRQPLELFSIEELEV